MSKSWFTAGPACLLLIVLSATGAAHAADPNSDAEELIRKGIQLRKNRDDAAAVREFQKAYDLSHSPRAAGQLGLAQQALGRWVDAERHVGEAMRATDDPWVARNRAALDQSLATIQDHLGRVEITGDPAGAEVLVNGRPVGKLPLAEAVRVSAGQVDIDLRAPGFVPVQRTLTIVGGQYQPVVIHLVREAAPAAARVPAAPQETSSADLPPSAPGTQSEADSESQPSNVRVALKWTAAGLAGAGLATGVVGYLVYRQNVNEFDSSPKRCGVYMGAGYSMLTNTPDKTCQTLLDNYELGEKVAIVGGIAAGVFAASWLILYLTEPTGTPGTQQASRWPLCGATTGNSVGIACMGRF